jgi:hypothetical protein
MYTHLWLKYLPIIRILMKRAAGGEQILDLNRIDFERAGSARKSGYKFHIDFINGRVTNIISHSPLAPDLANLLLQDEVIKNMLDSSNYKMSLNNKFQLGIVNTSVKAAASAE